jgi:hypothetical protein
MRVAAGAACVVARFAKVNDIRCVSAADGALAALTGINGSGAPTP